MNTITDKIVLNMTFLRCIDILHFSSIHHTKNIHYNARRSRDHYTRALVIANPSLSFNPDVCRERDATYILARIAKESIFRREPLHILVGRLNDWDAQHAIWVQAIIQDRNRRNPGSSWSDPTPDDHSDRSSLLSSSSSLPLAISIIAIIITIICVLVFFYVDLAIFTNFANMLSEIVGNLSVVF